MVINYYALFYNKATESLEKIHLGREMAGWKFLWDPNVRWINEHEQLTPKFLYPLNYNGILNFLESTNAAIIGDLDLEDDYSYGYESSKTPKVTPKEFLNYISQRDLFNVLDCKIYLTERLERKENGLATRIPPKSIFEKQMQHRWGSIGIISDTGADFYSDGLRFSTHSNFK